MNDGKHIFEKLARCTTPGEIDRMLRGNSYAVVPVKLTEAVFHADEEDYSWDASARRYDVMIQAGRVKPE